MRYKFFANCVLVKGYTRSTVCDLQNNRFIFLPNEIVEFMHDGIFDLTYIATLLDNDDFENFGLYIDFLKKENLLLEINEHNEGLFGDFPVHWDYPGIISNAIIEVSSDNTRDIVEQEIFRQLAALGCLNMEIRFLDEHLAPKYMWRLIKQVIKAGFWSIDIAIKAANIDNVDIGFIKKITAAHNNVRTVLIYNDTQNDIVQEKYLGFGGIAFVRAELDSKKCGWIHGAYFDVHAVNYAESLKHNTCLNRKISVDIAGNIKNCPSMAEAYGHIRDVKLSSVAGAPGFRQYWNIRKDDIRTCNVCEFRHICTDCRAYIEDPEDLHSKPLKCGYNPVTTKWEEWSTHPLKQKAIAYYGL